MHSAFRRCLFLLFSLTLLALSSSAKERVVIRHDLPFGYGLAQDSESFIWIGATDGLYRYDGGAARRWGRSAGINFEPVITGSRGEVFALGGPEAAWPEADSGAPVFRFVDLSAGRYTAEARASLDGANWSPQTARISFELLRVWYLRWWALALFAALAGAVIYAAHELRVATLLQLERQRARIALDLHDELGSVVRQHRPALRRRGG